MKGMSKMKIKVTQNEDISLIDSPYNGDFVSAIKKIGGAKWDKTKKVWKVPTESLPAVREIMRRIYGEDDQTQTIERINLRLIVSKELSVLHGDVILLGRVLSHASGRDSGSIPGSGVSYIEGRPSSGGSVKNWCSCVEPNSIIYLSNVPKNLVDNVDLPDGVKIEIELQEPDDITSLSKERANLIARIAEIDRIIKAQTK